jgi:hypothetical protein
VPLSLSQYKDLLNNMTIKKINEIKKVASSKISTNEESLNFSNTLIVCPILITKKPNLPKVHPSAARPSLLLRPAAFRPLLTEGLALSGKILYIILISLIALLVKLK